MSYRLYTCYTQLLCPKKFFFSLCTEGIGPIGKVPLFAVTSGGVGDLSHIPAYMAFYGMAE